MDGVHHPLPPGPVLHGRYLHSSWNRAGAQNKIGVGTISPRAFRRRIVRYRHWHPLDCPGIELGKTPQGGLIYTVVHIRSYRPSPAVRRSCAGSGWHIFSTGNTSKYLLQLTRVTQLPPGSMSQILQTRHLYTSCLKDLGNKVGIHPCVHFFWWLYVAPKRMKINAVSASKLQKRLSKSHRAYPRERTKIKHNSAGEERTNAVDVLFHSMVPLRKTKPKLPSDAPFPQPCTASTPKYGYI